jgi:hypothetical protein
MMPYAIGYFLREIGNDWEANEPERNAEVAAEGTPGRTTIVGSRMIRPSMNPLRVNSFTRSSELSFAIP